MDSLQDRVVVVTGGASGIGLAMAELFASEGAKVALADVAADALAVAADRLAAAGAEVLAVPTDVGRASDVDELAARVLERFGAVHVVCNNAGTVVTGPAWAIPLGDWQRIVDVNLWGVVHGVRTFVPLLLANEAPGYVVNTASMAGVTTLPTLGAYAATKHAVVAFSEVLFYDLQAIGAPIGVSVFCPGLVATHLGQDDKLAPLAPMAGAMPAEQAARGVREAMAEERFYVFTHEGSERDVRARMEGILEGRAPKGRPLPQR
jgi:NAD(P)-dependent dehydrogenase (short-subunit alcohol dehydrogenase family)